MELVPSGAPLPHAHARTRPKSAPRRNTFLEPAAVATTAAALLLFFSSLPQPVRAARESLFPGHRQRLQYPCPSDPLERCDFYFHGYRDAVPLLALPLMANYRGDVPISPPICDSHRPETFSAGSTRSTSTTTTSSSRANGTSGSNNDTTSMVAEATAAEHVLVGSTGPPRFLCPFPPGASKTGFHARLAPAFYAAGAAQHARVRARNMHNVNATLLEARCVLLPLTAVQLPAAEAADGSAGSTVTNLNPGDGNRKYRERRRCVVFKVGPTEPQCSSDM